VKKMAILSNPQHPQSEELAPRIQAVLQDKGIDVLCSTSEDEEEQPSLPEDLDVLVTLGGDGTMLRAAHLAAVNGTPILGIHMGRLGFLAEVHRSEWEESLDRVLAGQYWLEERSMLYCKLHRADALLGPWEALNDVVIGRSGLSHVVQLATHVNGGYLATYVADGLIVATATGSTAYALSAGGPILPPELRNMVLVPICPHLSLERTIVLDEGATVTIRMESDGTGVVVVDGVTEATLEADDQIELTISPHVTRFVRLYDRRRAYETLMERMQPRKVQNTDD
jgi:NAD+ kinase